jgi:hypothetical protein
VDVWTTPNPGVRHLHRTTPAPAEFHALVIDLREPGVRIRCTTIRERWKSTSDFAHESGVVAAINGGFWGLLGQGVKGLAAGNGSVWSGDDEELGFFGYSQRDERALISHPAEVVQASARRISDGVSGRPMIVDRGRLSSELREFARTYTREPRTAAGVSQDGKTVILVTVDGRRSTSHGGTLVEMGELMIELGAYRGINLDGGGSTTMFIAGEGGIVNRPSRGWEREVVNHIGVIAPPPPAVTANTEPARVEVETPPEVTERALQNRSTEPVVDPTVGQGTGMRGWLRSKLGGLMIIDRLGLGSRRELVVPALFLLAIATLLGTAAYVIRKILKRGKREGVRAEG